MNDKDIKILESYLEQQDRKFVSEYRLEFLQAIENLLKENEKNEKAKKYIIKKQSIQYKYALSKIECEELLRILEGK